MCVLVCGGQNGGPRSVSQIRVKFFSPTDQNMSTRNSILSENDSVLKTGRTWLTEPLRDHMKPIDRSINSAGSDFSIKPIWRLKTKKLTDFTWTRVFWF